MSGEGSFDLVKETRQMASELGPLAVEVLRNESFYKKLPDVVPATNEEERDKVDQAFGKQIDYLNKLDDILDGKKPVGDEALGEFAKAAVALGDAEREIKSSDSLAMTFDYLRVGPGRNDNGVRKEQLVEIFSPGNQPTRFEKFDKRHHALESLRNGMDNLGRTRWEGQVLAMTLNPPFDTEGQVPDSAIAPFKRYIDNVSFYKDMDPSERGATGEMALRRLPVAREAIKFLEDRVKSK